MVSLPRSDDLAPWSCATARTGDAAGGGPVSPGTAVPRVVADEDLAGFTAGQLLAVMKVLTMILTLPQSAARQVDALVVAVGQGEEWRLTHAIRSWEANPASLGLRRTDGVHLQAEPAANTAVQAAWIVSQVRARGITSLALVVSPYHLARVYLTVLKALTKAGVRVPMIPMPVAVSPDTPVPETGATAYDLVPGEIKRILTYMEEGWVATPEEVQQYLRWLWSHRAPMLVGTCETDTSADRSCPRVAPG
ncbi:hypothetical protein GCM10027452_11680 [Micromonospora halotolerans]